MNGNKVSSVGTTSLPQEYSEIESVINRFNDLLDNLQTNTINVEAAANKLLLDQPGNVVKDVNPQRVSGHISSLRDSLDRLYDYNYRLAEANDRLHSYL